MHELDLLANATSILEKYFGEYPWAKEKIGLCETPHLGMEHQSLIAYGNKFRYVKVGNTDFDWLLVHEFGHEWWANKVTNRDWADMWIQEGICTFADALHIFEIGGQQEYLKRMQQTARDTQNKIPIVQGEEIDTDQTYHGDIYGKGAFFITHTRSGYILSEESDCRVIGCFISCLDVVRGKRAAAPASLSQKLMLFEKIIACFK